MDEFANCANRLKGYLEDLKAYKGSELRDKRDFYAAPMIVFSIINESLRLAEAYMSKKAFPAPLTYGEVFETLEERRVIAPQLARRMKLLVGKRNLIAHQYGEIKREDVAELLGQMEAALKFAQSLAKTH